jgi:hypothetical protein
MPAGRPRRRPPRRPPRRQPQIPLRRFERPLSQFVGCNEHAELGICRGGLGGETGQELVHGRGLPVQLQTWPVVGEQVCGQTPVLCGLGVPDRLDRVPVPGKPAGGRPVQRGDLTRRGAPQLQLQQIREQMVVVEPGPSRVQRDNERVRLFQLLQGPLAARAPRQGIGQRAADPLQDRGPQRRSPLDLPQ